MSAAVAMGQPRETRLDRVGIPYVLRWGFVGVLVFMIGHGVEASLVAPHIGAGLRNTSVVPTIVAAYGVTVIVASYLSGALSDLMGPRRVMALGFAIWVVFEGAFLYSLSLRSIPLVTTSRRHRPLVQPRVSVSPRRNGLRRT